VLLKKFYKKRDDRVDIHATLQEVVDKMHSKSLRYIVVLNSKELPIGILTERDILFLYNEDVDFSTTNAYDMSTKDLVKAYSIRELGYALNSMVDHNIRRVIIIDERDKFLGVVEQKEIIFELEAKNSRYDFKRLEMLQSNYFKFLETKLMSQRATFEKMKDLVIEAYDFGDSQVISWANRSAKEKLHVSINDSIKKIFPDSIVKELVETCVKMNNYYKEKVEISGRFYRLSASSVSMFGASVIKILLSDFTELYLANRKLNEQVNIMSDSMSEQESMQNEIFNQDSIGIGYISMSGQILFANEYMINLLGYTEEELIGKNILDDITYVEDLDKTLVNKNGTDFETTVEKRYIHKDGYPIWVHITMSISKRKDGKAQYIIGFVKDIRDRKEGEKKLKLASEVFDNTNEGIVITDRKLMIQAVNSAFSDISGYSNEEAIANSAFLLRSTQHDEQFYKKMWISIKKDGYWKGEMWSTRKNGERFPQWLNVSTIKDEHNNITNYIGVFSDISMIKQSEAELEFLAHHDPLTKLPNRLLLTSRLSQAIKRAKRENSKIAVLFLDLDKFKEINDTFGHSYGDEILTSVTTRFKIAMREKDTIARIGGDEFIILIEEMEDISAVDQVLVKLLNVFKEEFLVFQHSFKLTASIGVAIYPNDGKKIEDLVKNADAAMYQAKDAGRNTYRFYTEEMTEKLFTKMLMKKEIDKALINGEFELHYQPQIAIRNGKVLGAEALVRWRHPKMGLMYPDKFIEIAESTKQIVELGRVVLEKACMDAKKWIDADLFSGKIAVNISAVQIKEDDLYEVVTAVLKKSGLSGHFLELELTESYMMENPEEAIKLFKKLKNHGITLSIDDFGTGYSSLSYLKKLPVDKLKIDRSFIMDIPSDKEDMAITSTIIAMAKSLGLSVIAEGIETKEQHQFLKDKGCYEGQGYLYSKAIPEDEFLKFLSSQVFI